MWPIPRGQHEKRVCFGLLPDCKEGFEFEASSLMICSCCQILCKGGSQGTIPSRGSWDTEASTQRDIGLRTLLKWEITLKHPSCDFFFISNHQSGIKMKTKTTASIVYLTMLHLILHLQREQAESSQGIKICGLYIVCVFTHYLTRPPGGSNDSHKRE